MTGPLGAVGMQKARLGSRPKQATQFVKLGHFRIGPGLTTNLKVEQHMYKSDTYAAERLFHLSRTLLDGSHQRLVRNQSAGVEFGEGASLAQTRYCTWPLMLAR